ncbi:hypothetical protein ACOSP7_016861 [Xanthoceras sorbifolium]
MDKSMLGGLEGLPQQDHARMASMIEHLQLRERFFFFFFLFSCFIFTCPLLDLLCQDWRLFSGKLNRLRIYNSLVERCFTDYVDNFTRKTLQKQEETCHSMRVGIWFVELNSQAATP